MRLPGLMYYLYYVVPLAAHCSYAGFRKVVEFIMNGFSQLYLFYILQKLACVDCTVLLGGLAMISLFTLFVYLGRH